MILDEDNHKLISHDENCVGIKRRVKQVLSPVIEVNLGRKFQSKTFQGTE